MPAPAPTARSLARRARTCALALLTATVTLGGECQEYLDSVAEQERQQAAALAAKTRQAVLARIADSLPRRKLLSDRLASQLAVMQEAERVFLATLPTARARLQALPGSQPCRFAPRPENGDTALLMEAAPGAPVTPRVPPEIATAQRLLHEPIDGLSRSAQADATLAEVQREEEELGLVEEKARDALDRLPEWAWAVVIERRRSPEITEVEHGLGYTPGTLEGIAYLYSVGASQFVCLSVFSATSSPDLRLTETNYETVRHYAPYRRHDRTSLKAVQLPMLRSDAKEFLRHDLDHNLWSAIAGSAQRAAVPPAAPPATAARRRAK